MAMSVKMQRVHTLAKRYDKTLKVTGFDPRLVVVVNHSDGTALEFHSSFVMKLSDPAYNYDDGFGWILVFTEHNGFHTFHEGDLDGYLFYFRDQEGNYFTRDVLPFPLDSVKALPALPQKVFEGVLEVDEVEDSGQARIASMNDDSEDGCMFVQVQSRDEKCEHSEIKQFEGKLVRVTVEVIGGSGNFPHTA